MIDIILDDNGKTLTIAHDRGELERVSKIFLDQNSREISVGHSTGSVSQVGPLVPALFRDALTRGKGRVIVLAGFDIAEQYECDFQIFAAA